MRNQGTSQRPHETPWLWLLGVPALAFSESSVVRAARAVPRDNAELWLSYAIVLTAVFLIAGAMTGLAAISKSQREAWKRNFIISAYVAMGLVLLGQYGPK